MLLIGVVICFHDDRVKNKMAAKTEDLRETFNEIESEQAVLSQTPVSFVVVGKPGAGKTTLAKRLAAVWKCQLVDGTSTIEQIIKEDSSELANEVKKVLFSGEEVGEELVARVIKNKLVSSEIQHYGYVLDCLPSFDETWKSVPEQIKFLKTLPQPPTVIINLKVPDIDLLNRRIGQRVDPFNNEVFIKPVYDPDGPLANAAQQKKEEEEDEEEDDKDDSEEDGDGEDGEDGEDKLNEDEFQEDLGEVDSLHLLAPNIADRLVIRARDKMATVKEEIKHYKEQVLSHIEDYIIQHNHQYVIELDACLSSKELFKSLLLRLSALGLRRAIAPKRLVEPEDDEMDNDMEQTDPNVFLAQVADTSILLPKFRWRRSKWSWYCPVELAKGNLVKGRLEYSVGLMDKMYCLSSKSAFTDFIRCPRRYLLHPCPQIPCKICVVGPPTSGKTSLTKALAEHYNATVINVEELVKPVLKNIMENAVDEAAQKAKDEVMVRLKAEQEALATQQDEDGSSPPPIDISEDHPEVQAAIQQATEKARRDEADPPHEVYIEALILGIKQAEEKRRNTENEDRLHGGWIVDGFPFLREHWNAMIETASLPDTVICMEPDDGDNRILMKRFCETNGLPYPFEKETGEDEATEGNKGSTLALSPEIEKWQKLSSAHETRWNTLSSSISGTASADLLKILTSLPVPDAVLTAVGHMEGIFKSLPIDVSGVEEEDDADDDPILHEKTGEDDEEDEEDEDEDKEALEAKKRKPWGDSYHFCPIALAEQNVLWPGQAEHAMRYRERLYFFSSDEAKGKFLSNPMKYIAGNEPLKAPAPRVFLLGPKASGKTVAGRILAERLGVFHISFRDYLQDQILPKMKWPPLLDPDEREGAEEREEKGESEDEREGLAEDDLDDDVIDALDERETELRAHLLTGEPLSEEALEDYATEFWNEEPYKSTGFIMEGLPYHGDDLRYLCSKGLYPDAAVVLEIEEERMLERILPKRMNIWREKRDKKLEKKRLAREKTLKEWEESKEKRKAELQEDYDTKKSEYDANKESKKEVDDEEEEEEEEEDDPYIDELNEQLAEIDNEEAPEEEEEEEETEEDVEDRMRTALVEKYEEQTESLTGIQDVLGEFQIPCHTIAANRKVSIVTYTMEKVLTQYFSNRRGILTKCTPIDPLSAKKLLDHGYKQMSCFGYWCPVKLKEELHSILPPPSIRSTFPVIYRQRIYFMSSISHRSQFVADPESFLSQEVPRLPVPMCLAILGPPKSGKTTIADRFVADYGCLRLSIGEAIRKVLDQFPESDLSLQMLSHLRVGQTLPDELCVLALERALLDVTSSTRGYILDGWPLTRVQVDLLHKYRIIPVRIVEMKINNEEMLRRAEVTRQSVVERPYPVHDSPSILLTRSGHYHKNVAAVKDWYSEEHDNWTTVDGERNCWHVWRQAHSIALHTTVQIQQYLVRVTEGKAASINCLCVTHKEFKARLGSFGEYCPVSFIENGDFVDCSGHSSLEFAVEYASQYYRTAGEKELKLFLLNPDSYVNSGVQLPTDLPCRRSQIEVKEMFPRQFEIQGFCPVTYIEGNKRYKSLVPGDSQWSVEYKGKLFCCASKEKLEKFMRRPFDYEVKKLPVKLPPVKQSLPILSLPMLGYMEQSVATPIINSLTAVGCFKPKFPFLTATQSALIFVALHLKAYNSKSSSYTREKYHKRLDHFKEHCQLIAMLGEDMKKGYQEPNERPMEFEGRMIKFLDLVRT